MDRDYASLREDGGSGIGRNLKRLDFAPRFCAVFAVSNERFDELVADAIASLPHELAKEIENVAIIVEDEAVGRQLFGLFEGIPLTKRGPMSYTGVLPDRITLYQGAISRHCSSEEEVRRQVRKTVIHELAHHFGISDERLTELGWA
jgi:predicted Zn-dependent protease with MMP-like domain